MQQIWNFLHLFRKLHSPALLWSLFTVVIPTNHVAGMATLAGIFSEPR